MKQFAGESPSAAFGASGLQLAAGAAAPRSEPAADPELAAHCSLRLFLDAAFPSESGTASPESLAAAIFAHGAVDGVAARTDLDRGAHARLERCLLRDIAGPRRRAIAAWRRTLRELEATSWGERLHRRGRLAVEAWLHGEAPDAHLAAALRPQTQGPRIA